MTSDIQISPNISPIGSVESLARHLGIEVEHLISMSIATERHWRKGPDQKKPDGSVRQTNSATPELKLIHSRINDRILRRCRYPEYLFGSLPKTKRLGRRSHIENARVHAGKRLVFSADIKNFFPCIDTNAVRGIWQYFFPFSSDVADTLTRLTTFQNEAPQGWACSSYLAQIVFYDDEPRIFSQLKQKGITYTRLTDDVTLSTNRTLTADQLTSVIGRLNRMLNSAGFRLHRGKTRIDSRFRRQSVNKININRGRLSLSKDYRNSVRALVHQITTRPESFESLNSAVQSAQGKISYIKKFHPKLAGSLNAKLSLVDDTSPRAKRRLSK